MTSTPSAANGARERRDVLPYAETRAYVRRILTLYRSDRHPYDSRIVAPSPFLAPGETGSM